MPGEQLSEDRRSWAREIVIGVIVAVISAILLARLGLVEQRGAAPSAIGVMGAVPTAGGAKEIILTGRWTGVTGHTFTLRADLAVDGVRVDGQIKWKLIAAPPTSFLLDRVGQGGIEKVSGHLNGNKVSLAGTEVDAPGLLVTDSYVVELDENSGTFQMKTLTDDGRDGLGTGDFSMAKG